MEATTSSGGKRIIPYIYRRADGEVAFWHVRRQFEDGEKDFHYERPDPSEPNGRAKGLPADAYSLLFMMPQLLDALSNPATRAVAWCEGEKDAQHVVKAWAMPATSHFSGSEVMDEAGWAFEQHPEYQGQIWVIADDDEDDTGLYNAMRRVQILWDAGFDSRSIRVLLAAEGYKDVSDHIRAGLGPQQMRKLGIAELKARAPGHLREGHLGSGGVGVIEAESLKPGDVVQASGARRIPDVQKSAGTSRTTGTGSVLSAVTPEDIFADDDEPDEDMPAAGRPVLPPHTEPLEVAREIVRLEFEDGGHRLLAHWRGSFFWWQAGAWQETPDRVVKVWLYALLGHARLRVQAREGAGQARGRRDDVPRFRLVPWCPTSRKVGDVLAALAAEVHINDYVEDGSWIQRQADAGASNSIVDPTREFIPTSSGLLDPISRSMKNLDPGYFNLSCVPLQEPLWEQTRLHPPAEWIRFLSTLWPKDEAAVQALQEMFGYMISGDTRRQKAFLLIGPPRSGKGTIARILTMLMGKRNAAGPTLASLGQNFGLSSLIGKSLAIISDARFRGRDADQVIERLLSITGEDSIDIDRKHKEIWTGQLKSRFLILSNELPYLADASGAVATRFVVMMLRSSWLGQEDEMLTDRLAGELPQILEWSLQGLDRLREQGRFTEPESSREAAAQLAELTSPEAVFIADACETGPVGEVEVKVIFAAWKLWCERNGRPAGDVQRFGSRLRAAVPGLEVAKRGRKADVRVYTGISLNQQYGEDLQDEVTTIKTGEVRKREV